MGSTAEITAEGPTKDSTEELTINSKDIILSIIGWYPILKNSAVKEREKELKCGNSCSLGYHRYCL